MVVKITALSHLPMNPCKGPAALGHLQLKRLLNAVFFHGDPTKMEQKKSRLGIHGL